MSESYNEQRAMPPPQAYARLMKLLPKLSAMTDAYRLKVLSEIDRVLAAEGLMWTDIAAALTEPPGEDLPTAELLTMIERIEQQDRMILLTPNARSFLAQMRERATEDDIVHLSKTSRPNASASAASESRRRRSYDGRQGDRGNS
jgi:hypothetical protein